MIKPGIIELLTYLKEKKISVAIASSTSVQIVIDEIREAGLLHYFDVIVGGDMVERSKPAPDIFLLAAKMLGINPSRCCVIEDSYNGIIAAYTAGTFPIMIPDMLKPNAEMRKNAGLIVDNASKLLMFLMSRYNSLFK